MNKKGICGNCRFWKQNVLNGKFGQCRNPETFSWVRGQSFEPPNYFSCINHEEKPPVMLFFEREKE